MVFRPVHVHTIMQLHHRAPTQAAQGLGPGPRPRGHWGENVVHLLDQLVGKHIGRAVLRIPGTFHPPGPTPLPWCLVLVHRRPGPGVGGRAGLEGASGPN